jgi:hypothetical protein
MLNKYIFFFVIFVFILLQPFCNNTFLEGFEYSKNYEYTHNVDIPLTTTFSCRNWCGPTARCSITGQQCMADIDCYGCRPIQKKNRKNYRLIGEDDAGILTTAMTPNYSDLTTDIGSRAKLVTSNKFSRPIQYNSGVNTWRSSFDKARSLFDKRYKPNHTPFFPSRYSLSGEFIDDGPIAANGYFN